MPLQYNLNEAPPQGKAYILLLQDPSGDGTDVYGVWTTKAPERYVHSKMHFAYRDQDNPLHAFLLDLKARGLRPRIIVAGVVDVKAAPATVAAMKRRGTAGD